MAELTTWLFQRVWLAGLLLHISGWLGLFLTTYALAISGASPILIQAGGALYFFPMFLGGLLVGSLVARWTHGNLCAAVSMGLCISTATFTWMLSYEIIVPHTLVLLLPILGLGPFANLSIRLVLVHDIVGDAGAKRAMTLEGAAAALGALLGPLAGGISVTAMGLSSSLGALAILYAIVATLLIPVGTAAQPNRYTRSDRRRPESSAVAIAFRTLRQSRDLRGVVGVTVIMNTFFFAVIPLLPLMGMRLNVGSTGVGILSASLGGGSLLGAIALLLVRRRMAGALYVFGSCLALVALVAFSTTTLYLAAVAALLVAGLGQAGFTTTQGILAMQSVHYRDRATAMGLIGMAIGVLPIGALVIGGVANRFNPPAAVILGSGIGLFSLALWVWRMPNLLRLR